MFQNSSLSSEVVLPWLASSNKCPKVNPSSDVSCIVRIHHIPLHSVNIANERSSKMNSYIRVMDGVDWVRLYEFIWDIMSCPEFPNLGLHDKGKLGRKLKILSHYGFHMGPRFYVALAHTDNFAVDSAGDGAERISLTHLLPEKLNEHLLFSLSFDSRIHYRAISSHSMLHHSSPLPNLLGCLLIVAPINTGNWTNQYTKMGRMFLQIRCGASISTGMSIRIMLGKRFCYVLQIISSQKTCQIPTRCSG